jgi:DNA modification methylase
MRALALDYTEGADWSAAQGDCVHLMRDMPESSVHLTVTSIPFASLLTYSASDNDFGNCRDHRQFFGQFRFFVEDLLRVTKPGRLAAIHCMILPTSKIRDGEIGLYDFRGDIVRAFTDSGWVFHSETGIWKCPVVAVTRTKAHGLLHKTLKSDSCRSRTGILDYLCVFRKPGDNPERVTHTNDNYPVSKWQQVASPIWQVDPGDVPVPEPFWDDINQTETLQARSARDERDEAHVCPLQTQVIERAVELWSNPGDVVFDPFGGIGSTGVVALAMGRRHVMTELKASYYQQAVRNLKGARKQTSLLDYIESKGAAE